MKKDCLKSIGEYLKSLNAKQILITHDDGEFTLPVIFNTDRLHFAANHIYQVTENWMKRETYHGPDIESLIADCIGTNNFGFILSIYAILKDADEETCSDFKYIA